MKILARPLACMFSAALAAAAAGQPQAFSAGNLVVLQVGPDGATTILNNSAEPVFLKEFTPAGAMVQSIPLPTLSTVSGNRALTISGSATSEGAVELSADRRYLVMTGYNADAGTPAVASTPSATVNRVVGRVDYTGAIDTTTAMTDAFPGNNVRCATSVDGTAFWVAGSGGSGGAGIRYVTLGAPGGGSTVITSNIITARIVHIFNSQLYVSASTPTGGGYFGVGTVGTPPPPTGPADAVLLNGFSSVAGPSPFSFYFADAHTLYVADDGAVGAGGGIQKWTFDGSIWSQAYVLTAGLSAGVRALAGSRTGGITTLYATTADGITPTAGNKLVTVVDSGPDAPYLTLATSPGNTVFRGVSFAPVPAGPPPCYANCDGGTVAPILNVNDFVCFQTRYAAGSSYANCDGSTVQPILNVNDFICFQTKYAAGCP